MVYKKNSRVEILKSSIFCFKNPKLVSALVFNSINVRRFVMGATLKNVLIDRYLATELIDCPP
jgi:hypothetical protein